MKISKSLSQVINSIQSSHPEQIILQYLLYPVNMNILYAKAGYCYKIR